MKKLVRINSSRIEIGVEKNKLRRIKNGKFNIEGTIDLHGLTLKEAEVRLRRFIGNSFQHEKRFLLVITGKGKNSKPNNYGNKLTIKSEITNWILEDFYSDKLQYISKSLDKHGGEGAYYFFLKKSKNVFS